MYLLAENCSIYIYILSTYFYIRDVEIYFDRIKSFGLLIVLRKWYSQFDSRPRIPKDSKKID